MPDATSRVLSPEQITEITGLTITVGNDLTITITGTRILSVAAISWVTYQVVVPGDKVEGKGATTDPTPPVAVVYHRIMPGPVAVNALAAWFMQ